MYQKQIRYTPTLSSMRVIVPVGEIVKNNFLYTSHNPQFTSICMEM